MIIGRFGVGVVSGRLGTGPEAENSSWRYKTRALSRALSPVPPNVTGRPSGPLKVSPTIQRDPALTTSRASLHHLVRGEAACHRPTSTGPPQPRIRCPVRSGRAKLFPYAVTSAVQTWCRVPVTPPEGAASATHCVRCPSPRETNPQHSKAKRVGTLPTIL